MLKTFAVVFSGISGRQCIVFVVGGEKVSYNFARTTNTNGFLASHVLLIH